MGERATVRPFGVSNFLSNPSFATRFVRYYFHVFVKTRRWDKPTTHDYDVNAAEWCNDLANDDWMSVPNCWASDFGGPCTFNPLPLTRTAPPFKR